MWCWYYNTFCQAGKCKGVAWRHATSYKRAAEENTDRGVTTPNTWGKNVYIRWGEKEQAHKLHLIETTKQLLQISIFFGYNIIKIFAVSLCESLEISKLLFQLWQESEEKGWPAKSRIGSFCTVEQKYIPTKLKLGQTTKVNVTTWELFTQNWLQARGHVERSPQQVVNLNWILPPP